MLFGVSSNKHIYRFSASKCVLVCALCMICLMGIQRLGIHTQNTHSHTLTQRSEMTSLRVWVPKNRAVQFDRGSTQCCSFNVRATHIHILNRWNSCETKIDMAHKYT